VVISTFYALSDTTTPVKIATAAIVANIVFGLVLMWPLAHGGLALATSLASILNLGMLTYAIRSRLGALGWRSICYSVLRSFFCTVLMGISVWGLSCMIIPDQGTFWERLTGISASVVFGCVIYILLSFLVKSTELEYIFLTFRKKRG
jgi:putative peptidoglycan lipid II flippase